MSSASLPSRAPRLRVGVIGMGRVGSVLGAALDRVGHDVRSVSAVSRKSQRRAEQWLPKAVIRPVDEVPTDVDLLVIAIPDDEIAGLVAGLANAAVVAPGTFVMHTSGAHGLAVLEPLTDRGALPLALHPAMTFAGGSEDLAKLNGATFGVTTPDELRPVGETLVVEMGGEPVWVEDSARGIYHAALALGANSIVSLVTEVIDLLKAAGIEAPQRLLSPLLYASLDNALTHGDSALTGPVARGDAGTVSAHLKELAKVDADAAAVYIALSRLTASRAMDSGMLSADRAEPLLDVLGTTP